MAWMEMDYSKNTYFRWKVKWRLEHLSALGTMSETAPLTWHFVFSFSAVHIGFQLTLVRAEIAQKPDTPKYVPVYFTYNTMKKDIPECMSSRLAHRLLDDVDRLVFHLTKVEQVQPYRTQPIVVVAEDDHPYGKKKKDLEIAVAAAAAAHRNQRNNNQVV